MSGDKRSRLWAPRLALLTGIAAVSMGSIFVRFAQAEASSLAIAAWRLSLATLFLLPVSWLRHRSQWRSVRGRDWAWIAAAGACLAVHFATWITSLEYTSVASSVALVSTSPLWVALLAWIFWRESLTRSLLAGLALALGGSLMISFAETRAAISSKPLLGNALAMAGALAVSGYWLIGRHLRRRMPLIPYITMVYGSAAMLLLAVAVLLRQPLAGFRPSIYVWLLLLALLPQLLGHSSFNWALGHLPASYVAIATLGEPVGAALLASLFLGEFPSPLKIAAAFLILTGITLALHQRKGSRPSG
ncbi:MAG: DMT family transporter [Candidatus Aminicenantes bacterium]|nr:DMT family transporter [Candidatus Aminicenantes bacterium]